MTMPEPNKTPSNWWWVAHFFFGVMTGLACYVLWKDENLKAAKKHLIHSIWLGVVVSIVLIAIIFSFVFIDVQ